MMSQLGGSVRGRRGPALAAPAGRPGRARLAPGLRPHGHGGATTKRGGTMRALSSILLGLAVAAAPLAAQQHRTAQATLVDESGERVGEVRLTDTPDSGVLLRVRL